MGKSYIENSLKRFLKRKVKITLGLVVTFMITGVVSFSADETIGIDDYHQKYNLDGILTAKENLKGLGNGVISAGENNSYVTIEKISDKTMIKRVDGTTVAEINNSLISTKTAETVSKVLQEMTGKTEIKNETITGADGTIISDVTINKGIREQRQESNGKTISNNGIIKFKGDNGQYIGKSVNAYNFGIIANGGTKGQYGIDGVNVNAYNYGIIANGGDSGQKVEKGTVTNYGIIANGGGIGQNTNVGDAYNYGIIANGGDTGQTVFKGNLINYGIIKNERNMGQWLYSTGTIYNYGIIANTGNFGQKVDTGTNEAKASYNYGLIANGGDYAIAANSKLDNNKAANYGVVKNSTGKVFLDNVNNYGIVILTDKELQDGGLGTGENKGILLDKNYNIIGEDTKQFHSGETIVDFGDSNSFGGEISKGFVKNESVNIENVQNKTIGAVITKDGEFKEGDFVFKYNGDNLLVDNSYLVGYFEKNGTLLNVGNGSLTLKGNTNITAVKGDLSLDVTAVKLGDGGEVFIMDDARINGKIDGGTGNIKFIDAKGIYDLDGGNIYIGITEKGESKYQNYFNITLTSSTPDKDDETSGKNVNYIELSTEKAEKYLANKLIIDSSVTVGKNTDGLSIYDTNKTNTDAELELDITDMKSITGNISLGVGKDTVIVNNIDNADHSQKEINLGAGEDKFVVNGYAKANIFNYNVKNAETVELQGGTWGNWNEAKGTIGFTDTVKAGKQPKLVLGNDTTMNITLNATGNHGSDFANYVGDDLKLSHAVITGTGNNSVVKYLIDEKGLDGSKLTTDKYSFGKGIEYKSAIFNVNTTEGKETSVTIKTASEMGLSGQDRIIYEAYLDQIKVGTANKDVINQINKMESSKEFAGLIKDTSVTGEAYYTAGSVVTMDIADTYLSAVEDFTKRAGKGEWLAQGKYINSDTEFDGGSKVKGYDGDVTGTVGMIEYGFTDNTSYGAVFGMGDSKMDIDGGGKLDGDNTYAGLYMKHRTQNGIELVANLGYVENDMDSVLRNDFKFDNGISSNGKTFEKGTADSSAVILSVKGKKDYRITDTVKVQPILGARATFINQEKAENPEMHFTIKEQDIIVVEGTAGMGIAKEFALLSQGKLELNAGVEYTFAATSSTNDAEYTLFEGTNYQGTHIKMEDVDTAENTGTAFAGFDYEHESGVGFNGKYEMMWSDKGDDSRVTAGISYRF